MSYVFTRSGTGAHATTRWNSQIVDAKAPAAGQILPIITPRDVKPISPGWYHWDMWQLAHEDGTQVVDDGRSWWFFLAASSDGDPEGRHDCARIHLVSHGATGWHDHGRALPAELSPGSREWSGSSVLGSDGKTVTLYFTATGRQERGRHFEQRLFAASGTFNASAAAMTDWSRPHEIVRADGTIYTVADDSEPTQGMIRGFRDPTFFRDPSSRSDYVLFTGSSGRPYGLYSGVIGLAERAGSQWELRPPLIDATGFNHELERAHIVWHDGLYYLFWSTHTSRFVPGKAYPTGLYGMVSEKLLGPWRPLNGNSIVACNPPEEPTQAYCWWVTSELQVVSFVNYWGTRQAAVTDSVHATQSFGGTVAPLFKLRLDGTTATVI